MVSVVTLVATLLGAVAFDLPALSKGGVEGAAGGVIVTIPDEPPAGTDPTTEPEAPPEADAPSETAPTPEVDTPGLNLSEFGTRMDRLFDSLATAETPADAAFVAEEIDAIWRASGGATAELLTERAEEAVTFDEVDLARTLVNGAIELDPGYMRAWSISAMTAYAADDLPRALEDIETALRLEPRHWESLLGLGLILERLERWEGAYAAYQQCLAIYPTHETAQERATALERRVRGREL